MKIRSTMVSILVCAGAAAVLLGAANVALATRAPDTVNGTVTALPGGAQLVVNGKTYYLRLDGSALSQLQAVHVGDTVELTLDGSANSSSSKVVAVVGASH